MTIVEKPHSSVTICGAVCGSCERAASSVSRPRMRASALLVRCGQAMRCRSAQRAASGSSTCTAARLSMVSA